MSDSSFLFRVFRVFRGSLTTILYFIIQPRKARNLICHSDSKAHSKKGNARLSPLEKKKKPPRAVDPAGRPILCPQASKHHLVPLYTAASHRRYMGQADCQLKPRHRSHLLLPITFQTACNCCKIFGKGGLLTLAGHVVRSPSQTTSHRSNRSARSRDGPHRTGHRQSGNHSHTGCAPPPKSGVTKRQVVLISLLFMVSLLSHPCRFYPARLPLPSPPCRGPS